LPCSGALKMPSGLLQHVSAKPGRCEIQALGYFSHATPYTTSLSCYGKHRTEELLEMEDVSPLFQSRLNCRALASATPTDVILHPSKTSQSTPQPAYCSCASLRGAGQSTHLLERVRLECLHCWQHPRRNPVPNLVWEDPLKLPDGYGTIASEPD
jgi:hypothetical protein